MDVERPAKAISECGNSVVGRERQDAAGMNIEFLLEVADAPGPDTA
jgi:hypothetical protein